jgi:tetratricopeptide (TPR) repeat protein
VIGHGRDAGRELVPRWRSPAATFGEGELNSLRAPDRPSWLDDTVHLEQLRIEWLAEQTPAYAADLVGAALVMERPDFAADAAQYLRSHGEGATVIRLADEIAGEPQESTRSAVSAPNEATVGVEDAIRQLRVSLARHPRNALQWIELARRYATLGQRAQAERAMRTALALAPHHRYALRAAARLDLHIGDIEQAHARIARSPATPGDPWLIAAEISLAAVAKVSSRFIRRGRELVESQAYAPLHLAELTSALATRELEFTNSRRARKLFRLSLVDPTENTVAQAVWAAEEQRAVDIPEDEVPLDRSAEAKAAVFGLAGQWREAVHQSWRWFHDQPFASRPGEFGSYQASMGQDFAGGAEIARAGLVANPDEFLLKNNLVFCLASDNRIEEARDVFTEIRLNDLDQVERQTYHATKGLLLYREGDVLGGRALYLEAISSAPNRHSKALAQLMLAREEILAGSPVNEAVFAELFEHDWGPQRADIELWVQHVRNALDVSRPRV